jgi:hypothetical protein
MESEYGLSRLVLRVAQILGWIGAIVVIAMGALTMILREFPWEPCVVVIFSGLVGGAFNHAVMAIGLAIFDLVDKQTEALSAQYELIKTLRKNTHKA